MHSICACKNWTYPCRNGYRYSDALSAPWNSALRCHMCDVNKISVYRNGTGMAPLHSGGSHSPWEYNTVFTVYCIGTAAPGCMWCNHAFIISFFTNWSTNLDKSRISPSGIKLGHRIRGPALQMITTRKHQRIINMIYLRLEELGWLRKLSRITKRIRRDLECKNSFASHHLKIISKLSSLFFSSKMKTSNSIAWQQALLGACARYHPPSLIPCLQEYVRGGSTSSIYLPFIWSRNIINYVQVKKQVCIINEADEDERVRAILIALLLLCRSSYSDSLSSHASVERMYISAFLWLPRQWGVLHSEHKICSSVSYMTD